MSFNSTSGARSSTEKSIASDAAAPNEAGRFFSSVGTRGVRRWYVAMFGVPVNALYSGAAAASYWLIGVRPRISSIVRSTDDVEYSVWSTKPRLANGLATSITDRCESTWSGPLCASSSTTNSAESFQYSLFEIVSTMRPSAMSLSATIARGVGDPGRVPAVWSFGSRMIDSCGSAPFASNCRNSASQASARLASVMSRSHPAYDGATMPERPGTVATAVTSPVADRDACATNSP